MGMNIGKFLVACGILSVFTQASWAENLITAKNPGAILNVAKGYGSATLKKDSRNDPLIVGRIDNTRYSVIFQGCKANRDCKEITISAAWGGVKVSMSEINAWNRDKKFGKAYLDNDGDPTLEMTINLKYGVSQENLDDTFDWWVKALDGFKKQVVDQ